MILMYIIALENEVSFTDWEVSRYLLTYPARWLAQGFLDDTTCARFVEETSVL